MEISDQDAKKLFAVDSGLQSAKMRPLSADELRALAEKIAGGGQAAPGSPAVAPGGNQFDQRMEQAGAPLPQPPPQGLAPMPDPQGMSQSQAPIAGFQGNSVFPNEANVYGNSGLHQEGGGERLDARGQSIPGLEGGLSPQPAPRGKSRITVDKDEQGRVTKITQTLTPGVGGLQSSGG